jgi:hypothetical protein
VFVAFRGLYQWSCNAQIARPGKGATPSSFTSEQAHDMFMSESTVFHNHQSSTHLLGICRLYEKATQEPVAKMMAIFALLEINGAI